MTTSIDRRPFRLIVVGGADFPAGVNLATTIFRNQTAQHTTEDLCRYDQFVSEHLHRIFCQIYRVVRNVADAQDITQEVFIRAMRHRDQLKDEQKAANWLSRIASNAAIDFIRRKNRTVHAEIDDAPRCHDENPERLLMQSEARAYFDTGLRLLTARERAALMLRDVEGLPAEEVAVLLDCSQATVRSHIANARVKLRAYLARTKR